MPVLARSKDANSFDAFGTLGTNPFSPSILEENRLATAVQRGFERIDFPAAEKSKITSTVVAPSILSPKDHFSQLMSELLKGQDNSIRSEASLLGLRGGNNDFINSLIAVYQSVKNGTINFESFEQKDTILKAASFYVDRARENHSALMDKGSSLGTSIGTTNGSITFDELRKIGSTDSMKKLADATWKQAITEARKNNKSVLRSYHNCAGPVRKAFGVIGATDGNKTPSGSGADQYPSYLRHGKFKDNWIEVKGVTLDKLPLLPSGCAVFCGDSRRPSHVGHAFTTLDPAKYRRSDGAPACAVSDYQQRSRYVYVDKRGCHMNNIAVFIPRDSELAQKIALLQNDTISSS